MVEQDRAGVADAEESAVFGVDKVLVVVRRRRGAQFAAFQRWARRGEAPQRR